MLIFIVPGCKSREHDNGAGQGFTMELPTFRTRTGTISFYKGPTNIKMYGPCFNIVQGDVRDKSGPFEKDQRAST